MDNNLYAKRLEGQEAAYEALCRRCGECCGADGTDPCSNLVKLEDGHYHCKTYETRLDLQKTLSGRVFMCVNIRDVIKRGTRYNNCPYCEGV